MPCSPRWLEVFYFVPTATHAAVCWPPFCMFRRRDGREGRAGGDVWLRAEGPGICRDTRRLAIERGRCGLESIRGVAGAVNVLREQVELLFERG